MATAARLAARPLRSEEESRQFTEAMARRQILMGRKRFLKRYLKDPSTLIDADEGHLADWAMTAAERQGGTPEEIEKRGRNFLTWYQDEQERVRAVSGRMARRAVRKGEAEHPTTVVGTGRQEQLIRAGEPWFLTDYQARLRAVKKGYIPAAETVDFLRGFSTPETRSMLNKLKRTPQVGAPEKLEMSGRSHLGGVVGTAFDILGAGARAYGSGKASAIQHWMSSGAMEKAGREGMRTGRSDPAGILRAGGVGLAEAGASISGIWKGLKEPWSDEPAPHLDQQLAKVKITLMKMATDEAKLQLPKGSEDERYKMAKMLYGRAVGGTGIPKVALDKPEVSAFVLELVFDPLLWAGAAPFKIAGAGIKAAYKGAKLVPGLKQLAGGAEALGGMAATAVRYNQPFMATERAGELGAEFTRSMRYMEDVAGVKGREVLEVGAPILELERLQLSRRGFGRKVPRRYRELFAKSLDDPELFFGGLDDAEKAFRRNAKWLPKSMLPKLGKKAIRPGAAAATAEAFHSAPEYIINAVEQFGKLDKEIGEAVLDAATRLRGKEVASSALKDVLPSDYNLARYLGKLSEDDAAVFSHLLTMPGEFVENLPGKMRKAFDLSLEMGPERVAKVIATFDDPLAHMTDLPAKLREPWAETLRTSAEVFERRVASGQAQQIVGGKVAAPRHRAEFLLPHAAWESPLEKMRGARKPGIMTGSALERKGAKGYKLDAGENWQKYLRAEHEAVRKGHIFRGYHALASRLAKEDPVLRGLGEGAILSSKSEKGAFELARQATEATGFEWIPIDKLKMGLSKEFLRVTSPVGAVVPETHLILPKIMGQRISELAMIQGMEKSAAAVGDLLRSTVRPLQNIWRINATLLRSLGFHATNIFGGAMIGALAVGVQAANPLSKLSRAAARTAFTAAWGGSDDALKTLFKLRGGQEVPLGVLLGEMRKAGIVGQSKMRYALDMPGGGIFGAYERGLQKFARFTRMQQLAAFGDDYQHAVVFLGVLDNMSPSGLAKAADFTAKFAGNYARMTPVERYALKEVFGFYTWNRFILPHLVTQIFENPRRLMVYEKLKQGAEVWLGRNAPVWSSGVPEWIKGQTAWTAPMSVQPEGDDHQSTMQVMETPLNAFGALVGENAEAMLFSPGIVAMIEMLTGRDVRTGRIIEEVVPHMPNLGGAESFKRFREYLYQLHRTPGGRAATGAIPLSEAALNAIRLYVDTGHHDKAAELWLRFRVGRDWPVISDAINWAVGEKKAITAPVPGLTKLYPVRPLPTAARASRRKY